MPLKIVYLTDYIYPASGLQRMLVNKANAFVERGLEVSVITCVSKNKSPFFTLDDRVAVYDTGVEYDVLKEMKGLKKAYTFKRLNRLHKKRVAQYLHSLKADVAISMHEADRRFLPSLKDGSKKVLEIHYDRRAAMFGHNRFRWSNLLRINIFVRALISGKPFAEVAELDMIARYDRFIVLTEEDKQQWGDLKNIDVIPNFIIAEPHTSDCTTKRVITAGRLTPVKGYDLLIEMWAKVDRCAWKLDIYGDGVLRDELQQQINEKGLSESVTLHHATNEIMKRYGESSLFLLTSRSEGFPMVLLEAMASGLPAVAFACKCGPRDMITEGKSGFIIDRVGDTDAMAAKVEQLLKDDDLRREMGVSAKRDMKQYGKESVIQQWINLFKKLPKRDQKSPKKGLK